MIISPWTSSYHESHIIFIGSYRSYRYGKWSNYKTSVQNVKFKTWQIKREETQFISEKPMANLMLLTDLLPYLIISSWTNTQCMSQLRCQFVWHYAGLFKFQLLWITLMSWQPEIKHQVKYIICQFPRVHGYWTIWLWIKLIVCRMCNHSS